MLLLAILSASILFGALVIGAGLLRVTGASAPRSLGDRAVVGTWIGLVVLVSGLLLLALATPLTPPRGLALYVCGVAAALGSASVRADVRRMVRVLSRPFWVAAGVAILAGASVLGADTPGHYDAGLYQFQIVQWLSRFGVVRGLALLHVRFGFQSPWFALTAPLNAGPTWGRVFQVGLVVPLSLACAHLVLCVRRGCRRQARASDVFLMSSLGPRLLLGLAGGRLTPDLYTTGAPEVPVAVLVIVVAWLFLVLHEDCGPRAGDSSALPLLAGVGAAALKLNGAPVAAVGWAFYLVSGPRGSWRRRAATGSALGLALMFPVVAADLRVSGCGLFPQRMTCVAAPWAVGPAEAGGVATYIAEYARNDGAAPTRGAHSLAWLAPWRSHHPLASALIAVSVAGALAGVLLRRRVSAGEGWAAAVAILGLLVVGWTAPAERFLLSYALIVPALVVARCFTVVRRLHVGGPSVSSRGADLVSLAAAALVAAAFASSANSVKIGPVLRARAPRLAPEFWEHLVWPARMPVPNPLYRVQLPEFWYFAPAPPPSRAGAPYRVFNGPARLDQCWGAPLPCTPYPVARDVRLADARRGLRAGFVRATP